MIVALLLVELVLEESSVHCEIVSLQKDCVFFETCSMIIKVYILVKWTHWQGVFKEESEMGVFTYTIHRPHRDCS
jgi:hypothetical protein